MRRTGASRAAVVRFRGMGIAADFFDRLRNDDTFSQQLETLTSSVDDPLAGHVSGTVLRHYAGERRVWLLERSAKVEPVRVTRTKTREVAESVLKLKLPDRGNVELPVAVAFEEQRRMLRVYFSFWPLTGSHRRRSPLLSRDHSLELPDIVKQYQRALRLGDVDAVVACFEEDAHAREPAGGEHVHRGHDGLRKFYGALFSSGGGIPLEHCSVTDDGVACAVEYNVVQWGRHVLPPQSGIAVYERGKSGLLKSARIYDDVNPPAPD